MSLMKILNSTGPNTDPKGHLLLPPLILKFKMIRTINRRFVFMCDGMCKLIKNLKKKP